MIEVTAYIGPDKPDPSARGRFVNTDRAGQYAQMLADSGDYTAVFVKWGQSIQAISPTEEKKS